MKDKLTVAVLNELVLGEAKKLKKLATIDERLRLSIYSLSPSHYDRCVYGQLTGDCFNERATKLIHGSCKRVLKRGEETTYNETYGIDVFTGTLNGDPKKEDRDTYWSPIELFITQPRNHKNKNIVKLLAFLRNESKTLELK